MAGSDRLLRSDAAAELSAQRRAAILQAAARCLVERGFDRVRLRDVARAAGLSIGLIQHYFDTRDSLLEQAFEAVSESLIRRWSEVVDAGRRDPWQRIVALIDQVAFDDDLRRHCAAWSQFCALAYREPAMEAGVRRIFTAWRAHLQAAIVDGVRDGSFHPVLPLDTVLDALLAIVDGLELNLAANTMPADGVHFHTVALDTARVLLGYEEDQPGSPASGRS